MSRKRQKHPLEIITGLSGKDFDDFVAWTNGVCSPDGDSILMAVENWRKEKRKERIQRKEILFGFRYGRKGVPNV